MRMTSNPLQECHWAGALPGHPITAEKSKSTTCKKVKAPLVSVPEVMRWLAGWRQNKAKTKNHTQT